MTQNTTILSSIEKIVDDTSQILQMAGDVPQMRNEPLKEFRRTCGMIPEQIRSGRLKIAVAGVIKSGKSTFVNSLAGKELVKRGAGVITSITTRIRKGKKNRANLYFKSWDQINLQLRKALELFPHDGSCEDIGVHFDIRRKKDRHFLKEVLQTLLTDFPRTSVDILPETLLIRHALRGFEACKDLVQADENLICFEANEFNRHKEFTADPDKAFYIKDVCLEVSGKIIDPHVEIADCQGADSTDPAQLEHVLSYLSSANLILYCISSRTGLRASDMTFLKRIKNLGLLDNILFINNCDITEHDDLDDLNRIEERIQRELQFLELEMSPEIYSFSFLYNLFSTLEPKLIKKEQNRLRLWREEKKIVDYCDTQTKTFNACFQDKMAKNRYDLLISNHLSRIGLIIAQVDQRANLFLDLLSSDKEREEKAAKTLEELHQNASRLKSIVANSVEGAVKGLKKEIESDLRQFFIRDQAALLKKTGTYIRTSAIDIEKYRPVASESGFSQILYLMFQEMKRKVDLFVMDEVTPELNRFVARQEKRIFTYFQSLFDSYEIDLLKTDPYSQFEIDRKDSPGRSEARNPITTPKLSFFLKQKLKSKALGINQEDVSVDIEGIKKILGLQVPSRVFEAGYTPGIKAGIVTGFFFNTLSQVFRSFVQKKSGFSFTPPLKNAAERIKKENLKALKSQFSQYHDNLKTFYFMPLMEAATRDFKEKIDTRFNRYHSVKEEIEHLLSLQRSEKEDQKKKVELIREKIQSVLKQIAAAA